MFFTCILHDFRSDFLLFERDFWRSQGFFDDSQSVKDDVFISLLSLPFAAGWDGRWCGF